MNTITKSRVSSVSTFIFLFILSISLPSKSNGDETKWIAIGMLHNWYSSAGCEIEVGRTHQTRDQQDGLQWPAQFRYQDNQAAKALWLGSINYNDQRAGKVMNYKVVHVGPRVLNEESEFIPQVFKMTGKYARSLVYVDGLPAGKLDQLDFTDEIDENLAADRVIYNVVNTGMGVTVTRKIYAFSQQNHDNYFIYDYTFKNTGIIDKDGTQNPQTLEDFVIFFQYRYAPSKEGCAYGYFWLPQSATWGHSTMNDVIYEHPVTGDPFRAQFTWLGRHSKAGFDNIGGPNAAAGGDGRLGGAQYVGTLTIHADKSTTDRSDDPMQPFTTQVVGSDEEITYNNDQFNEAKMAAEYAAMTAGRPALSQAAQVGDQFADLVGNTPGGYSQGQGFGPYTIAPGDSIHIVLAEGVAGINRNAVYYLGKRWLNDSGPFPLPPDSSLTTNDRDEFKNAWVYTGKDSIFKTFERALETYNSGFQLPNPPPPPAEFNVNSGGDRILLDWSNNAESWPNFNGYRIYRAIHVPDTTYDMIFECGPGSANPSVVNQFEDTTPQRGFDYYYYMVSYDDGSTNDVQPGVPLESSRFYTMTIEPANLKRPAVEDMAEIRVVPNPFNTRSSRHLQFGASGPDRIMFLNIPPICSIKIYTERGDLIETIEHTDRTGDEAWNSITSSRQVVVSGVYIAVFTTPDGRQAVRKFVIIR